MPTADEWRQVRQAIEETGGPDRSPHTPRLYALAVKDGTKRLAAKWQYTDEQAIDLIHDVLAECFPEMIQAESPRALFLKVLVFRAIDRHRKRKRESPLSDAVDVPAASSSVSDPLRLQEVLTVLQAELSPRDLRVFVASAIEGEDASVVALAERTTPANVYQIVRRARVLLKERFDASS